MMILANRWSRKVMMVILAAAGMSVSYAQQPVPEAGKTTTPDFGELPNEVIWKDGSKMVLVPGGKYTIGLSNPASVNEAYGPEAQVEVGSFYIDKYEVTNKLYMDVATKIGLAVPKADMKFRGDEQPASGVTLADARQYAIHLKKDLPTEAEWEIAARGKTGNLFPWGDEDKEGAAGVAVTGAKVSFPVGSFPADVSDFGCFDMAGNVSEWTVDNYRRTYYTLIAGKKNPRHDEPGSAHTMRGGNYYTNKPGYLVTRGPADPSQTREELGFRCIYRVVPPPTPTPLVTAPPTPVPLASASAAMPGHIERLTPIFLDPKMPVPEDYVAESESSKPVSVANYSPMLIRMGYLDPVLGKLYSFPNELKPGMVTNVMVPRGTDIYMMGLAPNAAEPKLMNLGPVGGEADPLVVIPEHAFGNVRVEGGESLAPTPEMQAMQYYAGMYQAMWNQFSVYNGSDLPVDITVTATGKDVPVAKMTESLEPKETYLFTKHGLKKIKLEAQYVGAAEGSKTATFEFDSDNTADHRMFILEADARSGTKVRVLTRQVPSLTVTPCVSILPKQMKDKFAVPAPDAKGKPKGKK